MVDTVVIQNANPKAEPTLEEQAAAAGIDVGAVDESSREQTATPKILGKFNTHEDLERAYVELQKKLGTKEDVVEEPTPEVNEESAEEEPAEEPKEEQSEEDTKTPEEQAQEAADKSGLNLEELSDKFWEKGALDESDYEALEKGGYPKDMVDQFIAGQQAILELETAKVHLAVGGSEAYTDMIEWASETLAQSEIDAFNKAVNSSDMNTVLAAVKGLKARADAERGFEPKRQVGGQGKASVEVYNSIAEMQVDMRDPRYKTDPAFRAKVEAKLERSDIL